MFKPALLSANGPSALLKRPRRVALLLAASLALSAAPLASPLFAQPASVLVKTTDMPATVAEAFLRLVDQDLTSVERRAAAMSLLNVNNRDSLRALQSILHEGVSPAAWRAVAEAVSIHPLEPPKELWQPMLALLLKADAATQPYLAEALGRYNHEDLIEKLTLIANDGKSNTGARRGAILALGHQRTAQNARTLVVLSDINQPDAVQDAAFQGLAILTGLDEYGRERAMWLDWWDTARKWDREKFQSRVMANLARRDVSRRGERIAIEERLLDSQRALYRTTNVDDRPAVLAYMLNDGLLVIRQLGIDLALQRLVDDLPFDEPLRQALRGRLDDSEPNIRRGAALLLRDLSDAAAADRVAGRLAGDEEQVVGVLRAYLLLVTRLPREQAIDPAIKLLDEPTLRGEAAGALASAVDARLLDKKQPEAVVKQLRKVLQNQPVPPAQLATLLGKVGEEEDWAKIAAWIDSPDPALKRAAAQAWAESNRSLQILGERVSDPIIEPIVVSAAIRRGNDPWTLRSLAQNRPDQAQQVEPWESALVAMSGRVEPPVVLETVQRLEVQGQAVPLLDRMLSAALERETNTKMPAEQRVPLLLKRAEMRLGAGKAPGALADYDAALAAQGGLPSTAKLSSEAKDRMSRGRIQAYLQIGEPDKAFEVAQALIKKPGYGVPSTDDPVVEQFLEAARTYAHAGQKDEGRQVLRKLRTVLGGALKPEVAQRMSILDVEITNMRDPAETATAQVRTPNGE